MKVQTERNKDSHGWIGTETINTRFGDFEFKNGYPTAEATDKLYDLRTFNRAVEAYLHFVTIMSMFYVQKGLNDFGLDAANKFLIWETLLRHRPLTCESSPTNCGRLCRNVTPVNWS